MKKILFILPFMPDCLEVYLNPIEKDETGEETGNDTGNVVEAVPTVSELKLTPAPAERS